MRWLGHKHRAIQRHPCFHLIMYTSLRCYRESGDNKTCTDTCIHPKEGVGLENGFIVTNTHCHTVSPMFACNYAKGVEQTREIRWTCIHVLIHVHILTKVWEQKWGDSGGTSIQSWDHHLEVGPPFRCWTSIWRWELQLEMEPPIRSGRGESDIGSQVDINTCNDAWTHPYQGVGTEVGWLGYTQCHSRVPMIPCNYAKGMN